MLIYPLSIQIETVCSSRKQNDQPDNPCSKSSRKPIEKRRNHSKIEKKRRDKMNTYITELASMIPMCNSIPHKLDKLTVLRMATQYLKSIHARRVPSITNSKLQPAYLSDEEMKNLILQVLKNSFQVSDGFVFVVNCDRGIILYASESITSLLDYQLSDLIGNCLYGLVHPSDVTTVKDQILRAEIQPKEKLIDMKTMMPIKTNVSADLSLLRLCPGTRRSFFFRMQRNCLKPGEESTDKKYSVIRCTGYLKSVECVNTNNDQLSNSQQHINESTELTCLFAVGHVVIDNDYILNSVRFNQDIQYSSRHSIEGKFVFIDQRATLVLGFLPQELLGTSMYEHFHVDDIQHLSECHKAVLQTNNMIMTKVYLFRKKDGKFIFVQSQWRNFYNPWTKTIEYYTAINTIKCMDKEHTTVQESNLYPNQYHQYELFSPGSVVEQPIMSRTQASKIGRQIVDCVQKLSGKNQKKLKAARNCYSILPSIIDENVITESTETVGNVTSVYNKNITDYSEHMLGELYKCMWDSSTNTNDEQTSKSTSRNIFEKETDITAFNKC